VALICPERYIHKPLTIEEFIDEVGAAIEDMLGVTTPGSIPDHPGSSVHTANPICGWCA
jgi:hypothetical protein